MPTIDDWLQLRMRTGTVVRAEPSTSPTSPDRAPGELQSSAKITDRYTPASLVGRMVVAVTGFEPIRVGGFRSDVLLLGAVTPEGVILLRPDADVASGTEVA